MAIEVTPLSAGFSQGMPAFIHVERCWPEVDKLSPCEAACPLHMDVPNYVIAIAQGDIKQALAIIRDTNPLPSVCGRVCHHPCEEDCNRKIIDDAIAIEWLKQYASEWGKDEKPTPVPRTKAEKIAIIGSGPAGLTAAHDLVKKGYGVSVFEAAPIPGGMLSLGIPDFILSPEAVKADIDYIKDLGVKIHTNVRIGKDLSLEGLWQQGFKAILVATGAWRSLELRIDGAGLPGVSLALPWLKETKLRSLTSVKGKVWVIGGGAVAMDVARTAIRLGAEEAHVACLESRQDMPAFAWEIEAAEREGVRIHPSLSPQEFSSKDGAKVGGINFKRVKSTRLDSEGRINWTLMEGTGSDYTVETDAVVVAIGQAPAAGDMIDESLSTSKAGGLMVNPDTLEANVPGIFAAGDISATGRTVSDSMAAGRKAATSIDQYLNKVPITGVRESRATITIEPEQIPGFFPRRARWEMPRLLPREAIKVFREADLGYREWQAIEEANRCLNCRMCANCIFERGQMCFETSRRLL